MGWESSLPYHWPHDHSRRPMSNCPGCNRPLHKGKGARASRVNSSTQHPFRFDCPRGSPIKDTPRDGGSDCQSLLCQPPRGQDCNRCWRDQRLPLPQLPSPSLEWGLESDRSSLLMASSMSDRSEGFWHSQQGRGHWEDGAHMKINLPVFKDEDAKDVVTYQNWKWDLTVYQHVGCRDHTLLPYTIWSLQCYPG